MTKRQMDFDESAALLFRYGIQADGHQVYSFAEAESLADELGYPIVVKPVSQKIIHKSDKDAVFLNSKNNVQLSKACITLEEKLNCFSRADKEGLLVQKMAEKSFEHLIGAKQVVPLKTA